MTYRTSRTINLTPLEGVDLVASSETDFIHEITAESKQNGTDGLTRLVLSLEQVSISLQKDRRPSGFSKIFGQGNCDGDVILCPSEHVIQSDGCYSALCILIDGELRPFLLILKTEDISFTELSELAMKQREMLRGYF